MKIATVLHISLLVINLWVVSSKSKDDALEQSRHAELCGNQFISELVDMKTRVRIWLMDDTKWHIEGQIVECEGQHGDNEPPLLILDDAVEIEIKEGKRSVLGRIGLRSDLMVLIQEAAPTSTRRKATKATEATKATKERKCNIGLEPFMNKRIKVNLNGNRAVVGVLQPLGCVHYLVLDGAEDDNGTSIGTVIIPTVTVILSGLEQISSEDVDCHRKTNSYITAAEGMKVTAELKSGEIYRGLLVSYCNHPSLNSLLLKEVILTGRDGSPRKLPEVWINNDAVKFVALPEGLDEKELVQKYVGPRGRFEYAGHRVRFMLDDGRAIVGIFLDFDCSYYLLSEAEEFGYEKRSLPLVAVRFYRASNEALPPVVAIALLEGPPPPSYAENPSPGQRFLAGSQCIDTCEVEPLSKCKSEQITAELLNGTVIQGTIVGSNCYFIQLKKVKVTVRGENPRSYPVLFLPWSAVRDVLLPEQDEKCFFKLN